MRVADIDREIETARAEGPLKDIVIQPCPALLSDLRVEVNREDPEPATIARIASRDVAMAAGSIPYQIFCNLRRVPLLYLGG